MARRGRYVYEWPRPMVTADVVVFGKKQDSVSLLLIKRGQEPYAGKWAFPGGFVEMDEELSDAAARELAEETGLTGVALEQMHTFGRVGRDPRGRVIAVVFAGIVGPDNMEVRPGDDAAQAEWFDIDKLPEMAFDHDRIADMAIARYRSILFGGCGAENTGFPPGKV